MQVVKWVVCFKHGHTLVELEVEYGDPAAWGAQRGVSLVVAEADAHAPVRAEELFCRVCLDRVGKATLVIFHEDVVFGDCQDIYAVVHSLDSCYSFDLCSAALSSNFAWV